MGRVKAAIIGSGNIGTDLMMKMLKYPQNMELAAVVGIEQGLLESPVRVDLPGGGGFGPPGMRDPAQRLQDLSCGLIGPQTNPIPVADKSP